MQSPAINCPKNDYVVDGEGGLPSYKIVEELADNNEVWAEAFLKGWAKFLKNGNHNLRAGPKEAWLGYYSLERKYLQLQHPGSEKMSQFILSSLSTPLQNKALTLATTKNTSMPMLP